jgi:hypothetical protein
VKDSSETKIFIAFTIAAIVLLWPVGSTIAPEKRIRFTDAKGKPLVKLPVEQVWRGSLTESNVSHEVFYTDSAGYVLLPHRTIWSPALARIAEVAAVHFGEPSLPFRGPESLFAPTCDVVPAGGEPSSLNWPDAVVLKYSSLAGLRPGPWSGSSASEDRAFSLKRAAVRTEHDCLPIESQLKSADA